MSYKKLYETLLENEDLYVLFDGMTGVWEQDKKRFKEEQLKLESDAFDLNIETEDDYTE